MNNNIIEKANAMLDFFIENGNLKGVKQNLETLEIPVEWSDFPTGGQWKQVNIDSTTSCLYKAPAGFVFPAHFHENSERMVILNDIGEMEVLTPFYKKNLKYNESIFIDKNVPHTVKFITETVLLIIWSPPTSSKWSGGFFK